MKTTISLLVIIATVFVVSVTTVDAKERSYSYEIPDIKNSFCGVEIGHQNCKCAFHNEFCDSVGMNKEQATLFVNTEFQKWVKQQIRDFAQSCIDNRGIYDSSGRSCSVCEGGAFEGNECVLNAAPLSGPFTSSCSVTGEFVNDWKKYSDFDSRIPVSSASFEVREYNRVLDEIARKIVAVENLEYQMEVDRLMRLELRSYKAAIVSNLKNNLVKSLLRLSWMTYGTAKGAIGPGQSYAKIFTPESTVAQIGSAMKFIQSAIPKGSRAEIDTLSRIGKVKSAAWNATLETMESGGDPWAIATQVFSDSSKATVGAPSLEFTDAELEILREQNITNKALDELIADSYKENALRRREVVFLSKEIEGLYTELQEWKRKEFERTRVALEDQCKTGGR